METLGSDYFDSIYEAKADPWAFETSPYEAAKYDATLAALPRALYPRALEIGCSIGVLTARLAARCERLLSLDVSTAALARARERCAALPTVTFRQMQVPGDYPAGPFDLTLLSEVGYYLSRADLALTLGLMAKGLAPGGHLLLVHWTPVVDDYPLTGDEVHDYVASAVQAGDELHHLHGTRAENYRLDLYEKVS